MSTINSFRALNNQPPAQQPAPPAQQPPAQPQPPATPSGDVEFSFNPQDALVMSPTTTVVHNVTTDSSGNLETPLVKLQGHLQPQDGKFVFDADSKKNWNAANAFSSVANTVDTFQGYLGQPITWAFGGEQLGLTPNAGNDFNAYYSRDDAGLFFFHGTDPVTHETIYSGNSGEVTGHEAGHALLDSLRPGYFSTWSADPGGFHESFGDILALLNCLKNDEVVAKVVEQTGGDLSQQNCAAALGEQLGIAINHVVGQDVTGGDFTRNAINDFKWSDPNELPQQAPPDQLTPEVHSWSRLWTGATYDVIKGIVNENIAAGQAPAEAIKNAADDGLRMYANLLKTTAPEGDFTYRDMANAWIASQEQNDGGRHTDLIRSVMGERLILPSSQEGAGFVQESPLPSGSSELSIQLNGDQFGQFSGARVSTLLSGNSRSFTENTEESSQLEKDMARLIKTGKIKWTEPNQTISRKDLFDKNGEPFVGVVRWTDGTPTIERVTIAG